MNEKALLFGDTKSLVGVVTDPDPPGGGNDRLGVIIVNAGLLHRVGPNRIHVQLARTLASGGCVVFRFDHAGIGDSKAREDNLPFARSAVREAQEGIDFLAASRGLQRFVLVGVCLGAETAFQVACRDPRVVGAVLMDGYNLPTIGLFLHLNRKQLLSPRSWARLLTGKSQTWTDLKALNSMRASQATQESYEAVLPRPKAFVSHVRSLLERGVSLCFVYTGESPGYYNYLRFLRKKIRSLPRRDKVRVEYFSESDHVFTLLCNQRRLVSVVQEWIRCMVPTPGIGTFGSDGLGRP